MESAFTGELIVEPSRVESNGADLMAKDSEVLL